MFKVLRVGATLLNIELRLPASSGTAHTRSFEIMPELPTPSTNFIYSSRAFGAR